MGEEKCHKRFACRSYLSTKSMKLFSFMVPLILISGFIAILGPSSTSSWDFVTKHPWLWGYTNSSSLNSSSGGGGSSSSSSSNVMVMPLVSHEKEVDQDHHHHQLGGDSAVEALQNTSTYESDLNGSSSSPPQAVHEDIEIDEEHNASKVLDGAQISKPIIVTPMTNESLNLSIKTGHKNKYTNLEKLEAGLQKARVAIKEAKNGNQTIDDPDYVPKGPMYWNSKVFHRSYLEMEKQFKVFVYEEGEPPVFHNGPCKSIYSMEGNFIHRMEIDGQFRTQDPNKAHVYFLPFSVAMMVQYVYVRDSRDFSPIRRTVRDYISLIGGKYTYWNRSLGADHFMLACHDWGPEASFSIPRLGKNSIRALCNANTSERFNPIKDVSFPEINLRTGSIKGFVGGPSASKRPILAFFAGGLHGPIRPIVLGHWENKDDDIKVHQYLPKGVSYYDMMRKSKFCLCPSGYEVASPRIVEALYTGCVPVLISNHYVPPFSDVLNWKSFSVEVSVSDIPNLKKILTSISLRQYIRMQRRVLQVRKHFEVNSPPKRYDVFHMILHSIWLRRLNVRIQDDQPAITN